MAELLEDFQPARLARGLEGNLEEAYRALGRLPGAALDDGGELMLVRSGLGAPALDGAFRARLAPETADGAIERALAFAGGRSFTWWTGPSSRPLDLEARLLRRGFVHHEALIGVALDLATLDGLPRPPAGITVERVEDMEALGRWLEVAGEAYQLPEAAREAFACLALGEEAPWRCYLGSWRGVAAAASYLVLGAGVAGVYALVTTAAARRLGLGAALALGPLRDAWALGYRIGVGHMTQSGMSVARSVGARVVCTLHQYLWPGREGA